MKVYLIKRVSAKTHNEYLAMYVDTGFGVEQILTMDKNLMVNLLDITPSKLSTICSKVDCPVHVADFNVVKHSEVK